MIAISYRRADTLPIAGRLYDRLEERFGKKMVFMDFDSIRPGLDFRSQITETISQARVLIAVIGPDWLGQESDGSRRIDEATDFVRLEVATALQRGIPIIPVLVNDTEMPSPESLPGDLREVAFRHALPLDSGLDFRQHAERLIAAIADLPGLPADKKRMSGTRRIMSIGAVLAIFLVALLYGVNHWRSSEKPSAAPAAATTAEPPSPSEAQAAGLPKGYFCLQSKATDLVLDLRREPGNGALLLVQSALVRSDTQIWQAIPSEQTGCCYLVPKYSTIRGQNDCLEIKQRHPDDYIGLGPREPSHANEQLWAMTEVEPGYYIIVSRYNGKAIDIPWGVKKDGVILKFWPPHGGNNQLWKLIRL